MIKKYKNKRVGIILSGGEGTRMLPLTEVTSKQLLPVYDKPMIYYPLTTLIQSGIRDICIITNPQYIQTFKKVLKDFNKIGINIIFKSQKKPNGIAESLIIAKNFVKDSSICLMLGDNIIFGDQKELISKLRFAYENKNATIFSTYVKNPKQYGVIKFNKNQVVEIVEKPKIKISNNAVIGLYYFPNSAISVAKKLKPSARNELEITDVNNFFIKKKLAEIVKLSKKIYWYDAGTHEDYLNVQKKIYAVEKKSKKKIGSVHLASLDMRFSKKRNIIKLLEKFKNSQYAKEVIKLIKND